MSDRAQSAVALGGGHGLHTSLQALRHLVDDLVVDDLSAIVTVADNGGSSGRLRGEFGVLPPGDLRMALAALCGEDAWGATWARVLQHRFAGEGEMRGHVVGNLLIVSLWEQLGDHVQALDWVGRLLGASGRVLPMALTPLDIAAEVVAAILAADWVVLGPGSWFSSVIPHLVVPELREALVRTDARLVVVLNLAEQAGETHGFGPEEHLAVLSEHAPDLKIHTVLADPCTVSDLAGLERAAASYGAALVVDHVAMDDGSPRHDVTRLAAAYERIMARG
jgi:2-phospho-L-lactate transferase/gluconeogenesis factor (CofD/UPF0052 family)